MQRQIFEWGADAPLTSLEVADPNTGQEVMAPKLMTVRRKAVRVAVVVTQCFDVGSDYIVAYSPLQGR